MSADFFIDKTHVDAHGKHCQEPVVFTLGIFNRKTRNNPRAWRPLGCIPNQAMHPVAKTPCGKLSDYHVVLRHILDGLIKLQKKGGFYWSLSYRGRKHDVIFKVPVLCIIGDTDGHDKLCGKYSNRTDRVKCLCRYCDIPFEFTGDPYHEFECINQTRIDRLVQQKDVTNLKKLSRHALTNGNAYKDVQFCSVDGVCQASPAEILHTTQLGLVKYGKVGFINQERHAIPVVDGAQEPDKKGKVTHVFSPAMIRSVEDICLIWGTMLQHQSCKVTATFQGPSFRRASQRARRSAATSSKGLFCSTFYF